MSKIQYNGKHQNGLNPYNYFHNGYTGYSNPYKKNDFKGKPKPSNQQITNNNYFENQNKNYYYKNSFNSFNNSFSNFNENKNYYHSSVFQRNRCKQRYNSYFIKEKN